MWDLGLNVKVKWRFFPCDCVWICLESGYNDGSFRTRLSMNLKLTAQRFESPWIFRKVFEVLEADEIVYFSSHKRIFMVDFYYGVVIIFSLFQLNFCHLLNLLKHGHVSLWKMLEFYILSGIYVRGMWTWWTKFNIDSLKLFITYALTLVYVYIRYGVLCLKKDTNSRRCQNGGNRSFRYGPLCIF